jgi:hypothetical protein
VTLGQGAVLDQILLSQQVNARVRWGRRIHIIAACKAGTITSNRTNNGRNTLLRASIMWIPMGGIYVAVALAAVARLIICSSQAAEQPSPIVQWR